MKTEYRMLWIDDRLSAVRGDIRNIENFLLENEILLTLQKIDASSDISVINTPEFLDFFNKDEVDFLLVDLNMPNIDGIGVINFIRTELQDYYTPIIFYSNDATKDLPQLIREKNSGAGVNDFLDGIYYCHRDYIGTKVINLMESKLKRENQIKSVRGMIIENVSGLDVDILHSIKIACSNIKDEGKAQVLSKVKSKLRSKRNSSKKVYEDNENATYEEIVSYIIENPRKTDQLFRAEILREILKYTDDCKELSDILLEFYNCTQDRTSLSGIRNKYAHQTEEELQDIHSEKNNLFIKAEVRKHKENMTTIITKNST
jgi:CheY-like chemotaxis protein